MMSSNTQTLLTQHWSALAITGCWGLDAKLQLGDGIKALAQMRLHGQRIAGLGQDLQQLIIGQEVEPGSKWVRAVNTQGKATDNIDSDIQCSNLISMFILMLGPFGLQVCNFYFHRVLSFFIFITLMKMLAHDASTTVCESIVQLVHYLGKMTLLDSRYASRHF